MVQTMNPAAGQAAPAAGRTLNLGRLIVIGGAIAIAIASLVLGWYVTRTQPVGSTGTGSLAAGSSTPVPPVQPAGPSVTPTTPAQGVANTQPVGSTGTGGQAVGVLTSTPPANVAGTQPVGSTGTGSSQAAGSSTPVPPVQPGGPGTTPALQPPTQTAAPATLFATESAWLQQLCEQGLLEGFVGVSQDPLKPEGIEIYELCPPSVSNEGWVVNQHSNSSTLRLCRKSITSQSGNQWCGDVFLGVLQDPRDWLNPPGGNKFYVQETGGFRLITRTISRVRIQYQSKFAADTHQAVLELVSELEDRVKAAEARARAAVAAATTPAARGEAERQLAEVAAKAAKISEAKARCQKGCSPAELKVVREDLEALKAQVLKIEEGRSPSPTPIPPTKGETGK